MVVRRLVLCTHRSRRPIAFGLGLLEARWSSRRSPRKRWSSYAACSRQLHVAPQTAQGAMTAAAISVAKWHPTPPSVPPTRCRTPRVPHANIPFDTSRPIITRAPPQAHRHSINLRIEIVKGKCLNRRKRL